MLDGLWNEFSEYKIPTKVEYDLESGKAIRWGNHCDRTPALRVTDAHGVKEFFKTFFATSTLPSVIPNAPDNRETLNRWVIDYLRLFCGSVASQVDDRIQAQIQNSPSLPRQNWRRGKIYWNFTFPGSWGLSNATKFRSLAEQAVMHDLQDRTNIHNIHVYCQTTEGAASARCLMAYALHSAVDKKRYVLDKSAVSCDVGGATTDIMVSRVSEVGMLESLSRENKPGRSCYPGESLF